MEEVLGFLGFSLGATIGIGLVRSLGGGMRPLLRQGIRAGLAVGEATRATASRVGGTVSSATASARENLNDLRDEAITERRRSRSAAEPRKIEIVRS